MGEWDDVIQKSNDGLAVLVDTPYGRAIAFVDSPVATDKRTPLTEEILDQIADEYAANHEKWPQNRSSQN